MASLGSGSRSGVSCARLNTTPPPIISLPAIGWWRLKLNPIVAFWLAYVITRPLGASFADWFGKPHSTTGLGLGDGTVSGIALIVFIGLVAYVTSTGRDVQRASSLEQATTPAFEQV